MQFPKRCVFSFLEVLTMDKVQNPSTSVLPADQFSETPTNLYQTSGHDIPEGRSRQEDAFVT
jgi:hypothetical protein